MNRRNFIQTLAYTGVGTVLGCYNNHKKTDQNVVEKKNKGLIIGIDGCNPDALKYLKDPSIASLMANGSYSLNAKAGTYTVSAPGWSNILCGVWEPKHGVTDNTFNGANYEKYPSLHTIIEEYNSDFKTGSVVSWDELNDRIIRNGDYLISHHWDEEGYKNVLKDSVRILQGDIDLLFVYFMQPDNAGHAYGFDHKERRYLAALEEVSSHIGTIHETIRNRPSYHLENWLTSLISDHSGKGKSHGGIEEAKTIPFIVSGPSAVRSCLAGSPTQVDVVPTMLTHLKVPIKPEWNLDGKVVGLK